MVVLSIVEYVGLLEIKLNMLFNYLQENPEDFMRAMEYQNTLQKMLHYEELLSKEGTLEHELATERLSTIYN